MKKKFLLFLFGIVLFDSDVFATDMNVALQQSYNSCIGISDMLGEVKKIAGINTAVTGAGTVAGAGALVAGLKKKNLLKNLRNIEENAKDEDELKGGSDLNMTLKSDFKANPKSDLAKAKIAGNWRTGLLAVNTATNVAGVAMASKNLNTETKVEDKIKECIDSVDELQKAIAQAKIENVNFTEAQRIYEVCSEYKYLDLSSLQKRTKGAQITSAVGAGTGFVGVITSAVANKSQDEKERKLDTVSNVLAGGATLLSGGATVFNAIQITAVKKLVDVADRCENSLK